MSILTPTKERLVLAILACIQFTHIVDFMVIMPLGPQFIRLLGIVPKQFSFLVSAYTISAGIFGFLAAFFLDRLERKTALLMIYAGFIVGTLCCGLSHHYETLVMSRILTGAFGGILFGLSLSIIGDVIPVERRGKAMGLVMSAFSLATVIGIPFSLFFLFKVHGCILRHYRGKKASRQPQTDGQKTGNNFIYHGDLLEKSKFSPKIRI